MTEGQLAISEFLKTYISKNPIKSSLKVRQADLYTIDTNIDFDVKTNDIGKIKKYYDLIFGVFPFGEKSVKSTLVKTKKIPSNWERIFLSLNQLTPTGIGFFMVEPSLLYSKIGVEFLNNIKEEGFDITMAINVPEGIYKPFTAFTPIMVAFSRISNEKLFVAEMSSLNAAEINYNYRHKSGNNLNEGLWVERHNFKSFKNFSILNQIKNLKTHYKEFEEYQLSELVEEVNITRDSFMEIDNSIYIPKLGESEVVCQLSDLQIKPQNYFQIVLDKERVYGEYLCLFFKSELGRLILSSMKTGNFISKRNKREVMECYVAVPNPTEQKILVDTSLKLTELKGVIEDLMIELSLNPKNVNVINEKFDSVKGPLYSLSKEDEILNLIRKGEGKTIEFKETFSKNVRTNKKDKEIEKSSLKNIVGFLNSSGGTLIIGVSDEGDVKGVSEDFFQSKDKYLLHFKNSLNSKIGSEFYPLIDYDLYEVLDKNVLVVECKPSEKACFYDNHDFYVRTNPATDKLEGPKLLEYIKRRFKE